MIWESCGVMKMNDLFKGITERIWVYGSLRKGEYNNYILNKADYLGYGLIRGFKLFSLGSFPFVYRTYDNEDIVVVEGYDVDLDTAKDISDMELSAGYNKVNVDIEVLEGGVTAGNVWEVDRIYMNYGEVKGGNWVERNVIKE